MKKSDEFKNAINNMIVYYYMELVKEGDLDPIKTIVTNFVNNIELTKEQKMFIDNEIKGMDFNLIDYMKDMVNLLTFFENNFDRMTKEDVTKIKKGYEILSKYINFER